MTVKEILNRLEEVGLEVKRVETNEQMCEVWFYNNNFKLYSSPNGISVQCHEKRMTQVFSWPNNFRVYDDCDGLACHIESFRMKCVSMSNVSKTIYRAEYTTQLFPHSHLKDVKQILSTNLSEI